jgi:hypothetical protein
MSNSNRSDLKATRGEICQSQIKMKLFRGTDIPEMRELYEGRSRVQAVQNTSEAGGELTLAWCKAPRGDPLELPRELVYTGVRNSRCVEVKSQAKGREGELNIAGRSWSRAWRTCSKSRARLRKMDHAVLDRPLRLTYPPQILQFGLVGGSHIRIVARTCMSKMK